MRWNSHLGVVAGANQDLSAAACACVLTAALHQLPLYNAQRLADVLPMQVDDRESACLACRHVPRFCISSEMMQYRID